MTTPIIIPIKKQIRQFHYIFSASHFLQLILSVLVFNYIKSKRKLNSTQQKIVQTTILLILIISFVFFVFHYVYWKSYLHGRFILSFLIHIFIVIFDILSLIKFSRKDQIVYSEQNLHFIVLIITLSSCGLLYFSLIVLPWVN